MADGFKINGFKCNWRDFALSWQGFLMIYIYVVDGLERFVISTNFEGLVFLMQKWWQINSKINSLNTLSKKFLTRNVPIPWLHE